MRFSRDRRGQSVVVGTVILFGFLILALGVYQVQVVPTDNANVEFQHSQQVEDDFGDLRNDVLRAGATGSTGSTQIQLGTRYPARTFFINPPPVSGSLETEETGSIRIQNATVGSGARENARLFWNATDPTFETRSIRYDADYNEFDGAPDLVYEHSIVAAEFDDAVLLRSGQTVVSDGRISLTALTGSVSESGIAPRSVDPRAVSASDTTVPLEPRGGEITLELPTAVENAEALAERWNGVLPPNATAEPTTNESVRVTLANGSDPLYRLALSEVSLDATGETEPAYIVPVGPQNVALDGTIAVEVRDRYNNPVPDAQVSVREDGREETTNDDGRAFFEATPSGTLTAEINGSGGPRYERVEFDVSAGGGGGTVNRTYDIEWNNPGIARQDEVTYFPNQNLLQINETSGQIIVNGTLTELGTDIDGATVDFATGDPDVVSFNTESETESSRGTFSTDLSTNIPGNTTIYATAGDDVDLVDVQVVEAPGNTPTIDGGEIGDTSRDGPGVGNNRVRLSLVNLDVSNEAGVETFRIEYANQDSSPVEEFTASTVQELEDIADHRPGQQEADFGDAYTVTIQLLDGNDDVIDEVTVQVTADGTNQVF